MLDPRWIFALFQARRWALLIGGGLFLAGCAGIVLAQGGRPPPGGPPLPRSGPSLDTTTALPPATPTPEAQRSWPEYRIWARLVPGPSPQIRGEETIVLPNPADTPLETLVLRLYPNLPSYGGRLEVADVTVNGHPVTGTLTQLDSALELALPKPLQPGQTALIRMAFTTTLPTQVIAGSVGQGIFGYVDRVYDLAEFYPLMAVHDGTDWRVSAAAVEFGDMLFSQAAYYRVRLTVPPGHQVVASGTVLQRRRLPDGQETWYLAAGPIRSFYVAVSDHYQALTAMAGRVRLHSYYLPGRRPGAQRILDVARQALPVFEGLFGPYPHRELEFVPMPTTGYGMEHSEVLAIAPQLYVAGTPLDFAVLHELAHQWWYEIVGNDPVTEPWLDEALADYTVVLYYEAIGDLHTAQWVLARYRDWMEAARHWQRDRPVAGSLDQFSQQQYLEVVYAKGALFLHQVRLRMGEAPFRAALAEYARAYRYDIATGADLLRILQRHSPVPLDDLVIAWLGMVPPSPLSDANEALMER